MAGRDTNHSAYSGTVMKPFSLFPHCGVHVTHFLALENSIFFSKDFLCLHKWCGCEIHLDVLEWILIKILTLLALVKPRFPLHR